MARKNQAKTARGESAAATASGEGAPVDDGRSFEDLLAEAEALAEKMEEGGLSLDASIRAYEQGVADLRRCAGLLQHAEERVKVLLEHNGTFRLEDFEDGDAAGDDQEDED